MKLSTLTLAALSPLLSLANPVARQAAPVSPLGYASLNGGTTGGKGGKVVTVTTYAELSAAAFADGPAIIYVKGTITGTDKIRVSGNKSIIGLNAQSKLVGAGFFLRAANNVIIQNLAISKVKTAAGDAVGVQESTNIWLDHLDLSSDRDNGKDYYDGLADFSHGSDWITVSNTYFHDHWKGSLIGHSDNNFQQDVGKLHVTYHNNYWKNVNSRTPSVRVGTVHVFNSYYLTESTGVDTRLNAQVLVESSVFREVTLAVGWFNSDITGYAVVRDVDFGGSNNTAPAGTLKTVPYSYSLLGSSKVVAAVVGSAGNTLKLG